jgi:hypothetical protein
MMWEAGRITRLSAAIGGELSVRAQTDHGRDIPVSGSVEVSNVA